MKLLLFTLVVLLHLSLVPARFHFSIGNFVKQKVSTGIDKLISKMSCDNVLKKMDTMLFRPIAHACQCVIEDREAKQKEDMMNVADLLGQISNLEEEVASLQEQMMSQQQAADETSDRLQAVCPDTSNLQVKCNEKENFVFAQSEDGCEAVCYYASTDLVNYAGAEETCTAAGGSLMTLDTMKKNALVADIVRKNYKSNSFWIGLTSADGEWSWKGGNPVTFTDWANGEPDLRQNCASLNKAAEHRWFDWKCTTANKNGALCELKDDGETQFDTEIQIG